MAKNKNFIWIILIVGAIIFFMYGNKLGFGSTMAAGDITNGVVTRQFSKTSLSPGETFTVTYATSGAGSGSWGVLFSDTVSGGCTPATYSSGRLSSESDKTKTYTAPQSGTCTFTGVYTYQGTTQGTEKQIVGTSQVSVISCENLQNSALSAIIAWSSSQTSANKQAALTAIGNWANMC